MTKETIINSISECPLFQGISEESLSKIISDENIVSASKNTEISYKSDDKPYLYYIIEGRVKIYGSSKEKRVLLNIANKNDVFGAASLFGGKGNISSVFADRDCVFSALSAKTVETLIEKDPVFSKNYIVFLCDRIRFLNKRIASFTAGSADKKLANYLISQKGNEDFITLPCSLSKLSTLLDMGRASLYRAFDFLEENRFIKRNGSKIYFLSYEEFYKLYGGKL